MAVTQKDIARELNISHSLVGKVLNARDNVWASPALRERIRDKARELGYRPNAAAQALVSGRANMVAVWTSYLDLPIYARYIALVQARARRAGSQTMIAQVMDTPVDWNWPVDGIIGIDAPHRIHEYQVKFPASKIPLINLGVLDFEDADTVLIDLKQGTVEAMNEFSARGCRRIAYVLPAHATPRTDDGRYQAYHEGMDALGRKPETIVAHDMTAAAAYAATRDYIGKHGRPDGVLVFLSCMTSGVLRALHETGARVPQDIALISVDDSPELAYQTPSITTVEFPLERAIDEAWRLLQERQQHPESAPQKVSLATQLIRRESSCLKE